MCPPSAAQSSTAAQPRQWLLGRRTRWAQAPTIDPADQPSKAAATEGKQESGARPADAYRHDLSDAETTRARDLAGHASGSMVGRSAEVSVQDCFVPIGHTIPTSRSCIVPAVNDASWSGDKFTTSGTEKLFGSIRATSTKHPSGRVLP